MSLLQRFTFYRERNESALAYYFARRAHVAGSYAVPEFLALAWIGGKR